MQPKDRVSHHSFSLQLGTCKTNPADKFPTIHLFDLMVMTFLFHTQIRAYHHPTGNKASVIGLHDRMGPGSCKRELLPPFVSFFRLSLELRIAVSTTLVVGRRHLNVP